MSGDPDEDYVGQELHDEKERSDDEYHLSPEEEWQRYEDWLIRTREEDQFFDVDLTRIFPDFGWSESPLTDQTPEMESETLRKRKAAEHFRRSLDSRGFKFRTKGRSTMLLRLIASALVRTSASDTSRLWQDRGDEKTGRPDTVGPVLKLLQAFRQLDDAITELVRASESPPPIGQLNVSKQFFKELSASQAWHEDVRIRTWLDVLKADSKWTDLSAPNALRLLQIAHKRWNFAAQYALDTSSKKPSKKPPLLFYSTFVKDLAQLCEAGHCSVRGPNGDPTPQFINLVTDCEKVLPPQLQVGDDRRKLRRRVEEAFKLKARKVPGRSAKWLCEED